MLSWTGGDSPIRGLTKNSHTLYRIGTSQSFEVGSIMNTIPWMGNLRPRGLKQLRKVAELVKCWAWAIKLCPPARSPGPSLTCSISFSCYQSLPSVRYELRQLCSPATCSSN